MSCLKQWQCECHNVVGHRSLLHYDRLRRLPICETLQWEFAWWRLHCIGFQSEVRQEKLIGLPFDTSECQKCFKTMSGQKLLAMTQAERRHTTISILFFSFWITTQAHFIILDCTKFSDLGKVRRLTFRQRTTSGYGSVAAPFRFVTVLCVLRVIFSFMTRHHLKQNQIIESHTLLVTISSSPDVGHTEKQERKVVLPIFYCSQIFWSQLRHKNSSRLVLFLRPEERQ